MRIYVKASKIYHMKLVKICETLFCHTIILTNRFYIVNKSAQTTNLLYTLCVESFYVIPCFLVQVCDLFRSKGGSVIFEGLVIPFLQAVTPPFPFHQRGIRRGEPTVQSTWPAAEAAAAVWSPTFHPPQLSCKGGAGRVDHPATAAAADITPHCQYTGPPCIQSV